MDLYARLCVVDTLERLGTSRYFGSELVSVLDEIYRRWLDKEDEIFSDVTCQAMAFRLLRTGGYDVCSDELEEFSDQEHFFNTVSIQYGGTTTVLELYRASQVRLCEEGILDKIHAWTGEFLKQQLLNKSILHKRLEKQVEYDLKNFHGNLDGFRTRRSIELYDAQEFQLQKTAYRCPTVHNQDFLLFSVHDFRIRQAQYQKELQQMERWFAECRLDGLGQRNNILQKIYILTAAIIVGPELSMARISYTKVLVLLTCLDDLVDLYGSREDALTIIELISNWKKHPKTSSRAVEIQYNAIYDTVTEVAAEAYDKQGYCVKHDLVNMFLEVLQSFMRSKISWNDNIVPTMDEFLSFATKSTGCKLYIFASLHFLGTKLSKDMFTCSEFDILCHHTSLLGRLLNDIKSLKREKEEGVLNSVIVQTVEGGISEDEAILNAQQIIDQSRRKVLQVLYKKKGSIVPRECKEIFWKTCKMAYCLFSHDGGDEFTSPQIIAKDMNALIWEPLELPPPRLIK